MPHQGLVYDVGLEIDPATGLPAYREVIFTVMRQSGKSTSVLTFKTERCLRKPNQRIAYTAQTGWDARRKLLDDYSPILMASPLKGAVQRILRGAGSEAILWTNGSRIDVMASSAAAGHGRILDAGVIDEAFDDQDDRREQAILPAMATRGDAQLFVVSTAGTDASTYLRRKIEAGRRAAELDCGSGIAYFEWSIPPDADVDDPEVWWQYMPALGYTISPAVVAHARQTMSDTDFRRGFGNQWTANEHVRLISVETWDPVCSPTAKPDGTLRYALEVLPDQSAAAIVVCGGTEIELVEHRPGTSWVVQRLKEITERRPGPVVVDGGGPAAPTANDLEREGVNVHRLGGSEVVSACMAMYNAVADRRVKFRSHAAFDTAVDGLAKRDVGDRFVFSRSVSRTDITPFMAATLAFVPSAPAVEPWVMFE